MTRLQHMIAFLFVFAFILAGLHAYIGLRISHYLPLSNGEKHALMIVLATLASLTLIAVPLSFYLPFFLARIVSWVVFPWMGFLVLFVTAFLAADALSFVLGNIGPAFSVQRGIGLSALALTLILGLYSMGNGLRPVLVRPLTIVANKLPASFDGFKVVQLSDLHISPMVDGRWLRSIVDRVNELNPDMIVITGDLADGDVRVLGGEVASLADLKAPMGVYFVTGNHDYYSGADAWCALLSRLGLRILRNERVEVRSANGKDRFDLVGVEDYASSIFPGHAANLKGAMNGHDENVFSLLLAHQPKVIDEAASLGVDLVLSGHTHAGQIWPFTYLVYLEQPYASGLHSYRDTQIYISPGTGFWGPPMRLGNKAEITEITLRTENASSLSKLPR